MAEGVRPVFGSASERFVFYQPLVLVYCCAQCLFYFLLGLEFPEIRSACNAVTVGHFGLLVVRRGLHRLADQERARGLFSQAWVAAYVLVCSSRTGSERCRPG